jgi:TusA-related sulfurtransferase
MVYLIPPPAACAGITTQPSITETMANYSLDARNMLCPMPVIKAQNRVAELEPGDILDVVCTDPGAINDIPAWCRINGHEVLDAREKGDEVIVRIRVGVG